MPPLLGDGTPRGFQGRLPALLALLVSADRAITEVVIAPLAAPHDRKSWLWAPLRQIALGQPG